MGENEVLEEEVTNGATEQTGDNDNENTETTSPVEGSTEEDTNEEAVEEPSGDSSGDSNDTPSEDVGDDPTEEPTDPSDPTDPSNPTDEPQDNDETPSEPVDLVALLGITEIPMSIPIEFLFVYNKLLMVMIELGESMLLDCNSMCSSKNMPIIECYHMFKAALAAKQLSYNPDNNEATSNYYNKLANTLLNYVRVQLNCITRNYKDDLSFTLPLGSNGLVNLFITKNDINTEIIVEGSDVEIAEALLGIIREVLQGVVITPESTETYDLTEEELVAQQHWHVLAGYEFVEGSSEVYINGVKYFKDSETEDYCYEEWIVQEDGVRKGVGIKILTGSFDVGTAPDEIHVEAKLLANNSHSN